MEKKNHTISDQWEFILLVLVEAGGMGLPTADRRQKSLVLFSVWQVSELLCFDVLLLLRFLNSCVISHWLCSSSLALLP